MYVHKTLQSKWQAYNKELAEASSRAEIVIRDEKRNVLSVCNKYFKICFYYGTT
jgi:hypothetical protein